MVTCNACGREFGTQNALNGHKAHCQGSKASVGPAEERAPARSQSTELAAAVATPRPPNTERPPQHLPRMPLPPDEAMPPHVVRLEDWAPPGGWHHPRGDAPDPAWREDPAPRPAERATGESDAGNQAAAEPAPDRAGEASEASEPQSEPASEERAAPPDPDEQPTLLIPVIELWIDRNDMRPLSPLEREQLLRYIKVSPPEWLMPYIVVGGIIGSRLLEHPVYGPAIADFAAWCVAKIRGWFSDDEDEDEDDADRGEASDEAAPPAESPTPSQDGAVSVRVHNPPAAAPTPARERVVDVQFEDDDPTTAEDRALFERAQEG